jgi:hypothetical protein
MTGQPHAHLVADRRYSDPRSAMRRFLEIANGLEAQDGRISIGPINRTMLDEGASVEEYIAARDLAVTEGFITMHLSRAYVLFTEKGADRGYRI